MKGPKKIKLTAKNLNAPAIRKLKDMCNQNTGSCYQCGNCSAGCPAFDAMDIAPHRVLRLLQLGNIDSVLASKTIWVCASCITCSVRCPRGVDIAKIMEGLRQVALRNNTNHVHVRRINKNKLKDLPQIAFVSNFRKLTL